MSTHPITKDTKIPFPCWLLVQGIWRHLEGGNIYADALAHVATHYSTNPPDQRPGDVDTRHHPLGTSDDDKNAALYKRVDTIKAELDAQIKRELGQSAPDARRIAEAAAKEFCTYTKQADSTEENLAAIIARHSEPLVEERNEARSRIIQLEEYAFGMESALRGARASGTASELAMERAASAEIRLRHADLIAERDRLRAEVERLKQDNNNLQAINSDLVTGNERLRKERDEDVEAINRLMVECEKHISLSNDMPWDEEIHCAFDALRARVAALEAELKEAKIARDFADAATENLRQDVVELEKDAQRYRYLRDHWDDWTGATWHRGNIPGQLDAAIDAARRSTPSMP